MTAKHISEIVEKVVPDNNVAKGVVWIGPRNIRQIFGVSSDALKARGLKSTKGKYDLAEVYDKASDLIYEKLTRRHEPDDEGGLSPIELKNQKTAEEVRKLKIENDIKEGHLVFADDVAETYGRGIRAMCDVLDAMPSRLKMQNPDISSSLLDQINQELIKSRNMAADRLSELAAEESE